MKKKRTKFRTLTNVGITERNEKMFQKFTKLSSTGKYGVMQLYEMLGDEFDIAERNSVGGIIRNLKRKHETVKQ